jgi:hypothetical protein
MNFINNTSEINAKISVIFSRSINYKINIDDLIMYRKHMYNHSYIFQVICQV